MIAITTTTATKREKNRKEAVDKDRQQPKKKKYRITSASKITKNSIGSTTTTETKIKGRREKKSRCVAVAHFSLMGCDCMYACEIQCTMYRVLRMINRLKLHCIDVRFLARIGVLGPRHRLKEMDT